MTGRYTSRAKLYKWLCYGAMIFVFFIFQSVGLMPAVFSVRPSFLLVVPVCIAICEGPLPGAICGAVCGVLTDVLQTGLDGFYPLMLVIFCAAAGLLVETVMRNNIVTAFALAGTTTAVIKILCWYFFTWFAGVDRTSFTFVNRTLPALAYTLLLIAPVYFLTLWIRSGFDVIND